MVQKVKTRSIIALTFETDIFYQYLPAIKLLAEIKKRFNSFVYLASFLAVMAG